MTEDEEKFRKGFHLTKNGSDSITYTDALTVPEHTAGLRISRHRGEDVYEFSLHDGIVGEIWLGRYDYAKRRWIMTYMTGRHFLAELNAFIETHEYLFTGMEHKK